MSTLRYGWARISIFVTTRWRGLLLAFLLVGIFFWTNWYFSPAKRLDRIASNMVDFASQEVSSSDIAKMMDFLHVSVGGSMSIRTSCTLPPCTVTMSHYYFTHTTDSEKEKTWVLEVEVMLNPYFSDSRAFNLMPTKIEWKELDWRWSVGIISRENPAGNIFYSGQMAQLGNAPKINGENAMGSILSAMAIGMNKGLHGQ